MEGAGRGGGVREEEESLPGMREELRGLHAKGGGQRWVECDIHGWEQRYRGKLAKVVPALSGAAPDTELSQPARVCIRLLPIMALAPGLPHS